MIVAVTGGEGFIGKAVMKRLLRQGHFPRSVDRSNGVDLMGPFLSAELSKCDAVIHLAGVLGTSELFDTAEEAVDINIKGTLRVLECCKMMHLRYVGITMPYVWYNVYQATKKAAYTLAMAYNQHFGVPVSHIRAFNVFGPGQKVGSPQKIIPTFASKAWAGEPIPVWGDGTQTVDLIHVQDVARMLVDALSYGKGEIFDAGTGNAWSVNSIAEAAIIMTGSHSHVEYHHMRAGEHEAKVCAEGLGWSTLGWSPKFGLEDLRQTIFSYKPVLK